MRNLLDSLRAVANHRPCNPPKFTRSPEGKGIQPSVRGSPVSGYATNRPNANGWIDPALQDNLSPIGLNQNSGDTLGCLLFVVPFLAHFRSDPDKFRVAALDRVDGVDVIHVKSVGIAPVSRSMLGEMLDRKSRRELARFVAAVEPYFPAINEYLNSLNDAAHSEAAVALGSLAECAAEAKTILGDSTKNLARQGKRI